MSAQITIGSSAGKDRNQRTGNAHIFIYRPKVTGENIPSSVCQLCYAI